MAVEVASGEAENARALLLEVVPEGFEEVERSGALELAAYVDEAGERRLRELFTDVRADLVAPGWEDRWRAFHRPVRIGPLWIGPPWEQAPADSVTVVIDPGRAFGTGAHATTQLCLELLLGVPQGSVLDLGCGSGVLAIAASKLGFEPVWALDLDPDAVEAARRNTRANRVDVIVEPGDARVAASAAVDVAIANIALDVVESLVPQLRARHAITSGYLARDRLELPDYERLQRCERGGWAADLHVRK